MNGRIDYSRFTGVAEKGEAARQLSALQHPRSQTEIERNPSYFQKQQEQEGRSEWSGSYMGGGTWGGRSR